MCPDETENSSGEMVNGLNDTEDNLDETMCPSVTESGHDETMCPDKTGEGLNATVSSLTAIMKDTVQNVISRLEKVPEHVERATETHLDPSNPDNWNTLNYELSKDWRNVLVVALYDLMYLGSWTGVAFLSRIIVQLHNKRRMERYYKRKHEMRGIRKPHSDNPPPSPEELTAQWDKTRGSLQEVLRFGNMLIDLEASDLIDNSPILDYNTENGIPAIVARNPGLKGWLKKNCPRIGYKTAMRYKSLAQKAQKVEKDHVEAFIKQSSNIGDLSENLHKELKLEHFKLEKPRSPRTKSKVKDTRPSRRKKPLKQRKRKNPLISLIRTRIRASLKKMLPEQQQDFVDLLHSLVAECDEVLHQSTGESNLGKNVATYSH